MRQCCGSKGSRRRRTGLLRGRDEKTVAYHCACIIAENKKKQKESDDFFCFFGYFIAALKLDKTKPHIL
jgi:hypothetical protein